MKNNINHGLGHFGYLHNPDHTYNHWGIHPIWPLVHYDTNEPRTLQMEQEVFAQMTRWASGEDIITAGKITEEAFTELLIKFNQTKDQGEQIGILQKVLNDWFGENEIELASKYAYRKEDGKKNREAFFCDAQGHRYKQEDYPGTILPKFECTI